MGSKVKIMRRSDHSVFEIGGPISGGGEECITPSMFDSITKDWQPGESRRVKSINFETPRERLKRAMRESSGIANDHRNSLDAWSHLYSACLEYTETEGEE